MKTTVKKELDKLSKRKKLLKAQAIVDFAKNPKTALHDYFEWDDKIAGNEFRLQQARRIIRVYIEETPYSDVPQRIRISLKQDRIKAHGGYRRLQDVISDKDLWQEYEEQCLVDLIYLRDKYNDIKKYHCIWQEINKLEKAKTDSKKRKRA